MKATTRAEMEQSLTAVLRLVLATDDLDAETSLFSAGGSSMHAEIYARAASEATGRAITFTDVFQNPSPAEMADALAEQDDATIADVALSPRGDPAQWRPVSENQAVRLERLRLSEASGEPMFRSDVEIVGTCLEITGLIDVPALAEAIEEVVRHTSALRTVFDWRSGAMRQRVSPEVFGLERIDAVDRSASEVADAAHRPFALDSGQLGRFVLATFAPDRHHLRIVLEHIVSDAVSLNVIVTALARAYSRRVRGLAGPLTPGGVTSVSDDIEGFEFAGVEASWCDSPQGRNAEEYWLAQIGDGPVWRPFEHPAITPASDPHGEDVLVLHVADRDAGRRLSARAAELGTTSHALTIFSLSRAAARVTGVPDTTIYWYTANRTFPKVATTVGSLAGITLARVVSDPETHGEDEVRRVAAIVAQSMAQAFYPIERIARVHRPKDWVLPDDRAVLVLHVNPETGSDEVPEAVPAEWAGLRTVPAPAIGWRGRRGYTVDASTRLTDNAFVIGISYRADMLSPAIAREFLDAFRIELLAFTENTTKGVLS